MNSFKQNFLWKLTTKGKQKQFLPKIISKKNKKDPKGLCNFNLKYVYRFFCIHSTDIVFWLGKIIPKKNFDINIFLLL